MPFAKFGPFEIPRVYFIEEGLRDQAQTRETAGGVERRDVVAVKRTWEVRTRPVPLAAVQAIESYLWSILWGYDRWWIADFGPEENAIIARIDAGSWRKGWILGRQDLRTLSFMVFERGLTDGS